MTTATLDRQCKDHALLIADDGRMWDVYGNTWTELKTEAALLAQDLGLEITAFNSEVPE